MQRCIRAPISDEERTTASTLGVKFSIASILDTGVIDEKPTVASIVDEDGQYCSDLR